MNAEKTFGKGMDLSTKVLKPEKQESKFSEHFGGKHVKPENYEVAETKK